MRIPGVGMQAAFIKPASGFNKVGIGLKSGCSIYQNYRPILYFCVLLCQIHLFISRMIEWLVCFCRLRGNDLTKMSGSMLSIILKTLPILEWLM